MGLHDFKALERLAFPSPPLLAPRYYQWQPALTHLTPSHGLARAANRIALDSSLVREANVQTTLTTNLV